MKTINFCEKNCVCYLQFRKWHYICILYSEILKLLQVLSQACINGLRALLYLASQDRQEGYTSIKEMADKLDISFYFLTKILQMLTQKEILQSYRGPNGGVSLAVKPEDLYLLDVMHLFEGDDFLDTCLLGMPGCGEMKPCPVHEFWKHTKGALKEEFGQTSLAMLAEQIRLGEVRLHGLE
jgi:Rrf2 family protein